MIGSHWELGQPDRAAPTLRRSTRELRDDMVPGGFCEISDDRRGLWRSVTEKLGEAEKMKKRREEERSIAEKIGDGCGASEQVSRCRVSADDCHSPVQDTRYAEQRESSVG